VHDVGGGAGLTGCDPGVCVCQVIRTLFGLLMWDLIFAPVPDVFQSKYQVHTRMT
jgi:hypothetical protein